MRLTEALAAWWAEQTETTLGETLFIGDGPQSPAADVAILRDTAAVARGYEPVEPFSFQLTVIGGDYAAAMTLARTYYAAIYPPPDRLPQRNLDLGNGWRALSIDAVQPPFDLGAGDDGRRRVVFNIQVRAHETAPHE